jgi:hypothetical protein
MLPLLMKGREWLLELMADADHLGKTFTDAQAVVCLCLLLPPVLFRSGDDSNALVNFTEQRAHDDWCR